MRVSATLAGLALASCALAIPEPAELCESANAPAHCLPTDTNVDLFTDDGSSSADADPSRDGGSEDGSMSDGSPTLLDAGDTGTDEELDAAGDAVADATAEQAATCESLMAARIVELFVNPEGADTGAEFVEVWVPIAPAGLVELAFHNGDSPDPYLTALVPEGLGGRRLLGAGGSSPLNGTIQNGPDVVSLRVCGELVQTIAYAGSAGQAEELAPGAEHAVVASGVSSVRCPADGGEGDAPPPRDAAGVAAGDAAWGLAAQSPGGMSDAFLDGTCAAPCEPLDEGSAWINEVRYDPDGADGAGEEEFIELMASRAIDWANLSIETINGSSGAPYGDPITLSGFGRVAVIGGADVPYVTHALPRAMQNGPDGLLLLSCHDHIVDALSYGDPGGSAALEGPPAPDVSGRSIGRDPWGTDTDDNAADFRELVRITPGAPNF